MKRIMAVSVLTVAGLLSVVGCTKTVYVTTTDAPAAPTSTIIPTTTVVSFSNDLRKAAASCLDSMPELRLWDSASLVSSSGLERNVEECREFRILGLAEKADSKLLDALTLDLDEHLATVQYITSWMDQCDKSTTNGFDVVDNLASSNCRFMGMVLREGLVIERQRASRITQNLQELLSQ